MLTSILVSGTLVKEVKKLSFELKIGLFKLFNAYTTIFDSLTGASGTLVSIFFKINRLLYWSLYQIKKIKKKNTGLTQAASKKVNLIDYV